MGAAASIPIEYQYLSNENKEELKKEYEVMMSSKDGEDDQEVINSLIKKHAEALPSYNGGWMAYVTQLQSACPGTAEIMITDLKGSILAANCLVRWPADITSLISVLSGATETTSISLTEQKWITLSNAYMDGILLLVYSTTGICVWKLNTIFLIVQHTDQIKLERIVTTTGRIVDYLKNNGC
jgi:hypothetical protein